VENAEVSPKEEEEELEAEEEGGGIGNGVVDECAEEGGGESISEKASDSVFSELGVDVVAACSSSLA